MTPKDPFLEGTFWDKFWRPLRSRALLFTPDQRGVHGVVNLGGILTTHRPLNGPF